MKLVRFGKAGQEKPGLVDEAGTVRDLSAVVDDFTPERMTHDLIARISSIDISSLPAVDAGVRMGLDRATAKKITHQTIVGSMEVWKKRPVPPSELMNEACTPGGISVECVFTLDKLGFRAAVSEAIKNGAIKADQLGG